MQREFDPDEKVSPRDVASYVRDVAEQLACMARDVGLTRVATTLEQVRLEAVAILQANAAPDDAA